MSAGDLQSGQKDAAQGTPLILLVDDDPILQKIIELSLQRMNYSVLAAKSGAAALEIARQHPDIALVITDVIMPGMNGAALAHRLRESHPHTPVLFISGNSWETVTKGGLSAERLYFLQKPFPPAQLDQRIREIFAAGPQT